MSDGRLLDAVSKQFDTVIETMRFVHDHPELAYEEFECCDHLCERLAPALEVERGLAGMETGFKATLRGSGSGRTVGIVAVYDAVAVERDGILEAVHSCGHGPISGAVVGAALALAELRDSTPGTLVVFGCPADETGSPGMIEHGGGKANSVAAGAWEGVEAALYAHPESHGGVWHRSRWMRRDSVTIEGDQDPEAWPAVGEDVRVERVEATQDTGGTPITRILVRIFGEDEAAIERRADEVRAMLPNGATWIPGRLTAGLRSDRRVVEAVEDVFGVLGRPFIADTPVMPFSNDFGNVTEVVPSALIGMARPEGWAVHTDEGTAQFASPEGERLAREMAEVLALTASRLMRP